MVLMLLLSLSTRSNLFLKTLANYRAFKSRYRTVLAEFNCISGVN